MTTKRISARFPSDLLEEMDVIAAVERLDRTELMRQAISEFLKKARRDADLREKIVELYFAGKLPFGREFPMGRHPNQTT